MKESNDWKRVAANLIYKNYPDSDLLPIEPPGPGQDIDSYKETARDAYDTLFLFICLEAADDGLTADDFVRRLDAAARDIAAIKEATEEYSARRKIWDSIEC